jgi:hypothetical protein
MERSETVRNGQRSETVNGQECIETLEPERSNALERIMENAHVHDSKTKESL